MAFPPKQSATSAATLPEEDRGDEDGVELLQAETAEEGPPDTVVVEYAAPPATAGGNHANVEAEEDAWDQPG